MSRCEISLKDQEYLLYLCPFLMCFWTCKRDLLFNSQEIRGWYYLLSEELGRSKHLRVATRRVKQSHGELR